MPSIDVHHALATDGAQVDLDLGPLAWVLDELRKSLEGAVKAMRRFVRDAETARESDLAALDAGSLRIARQQLHQACGALEMVGMAPPALVLRAMESAVQKFVQRPETCSDEAAAVIERASFALIEYLETVLAGKPVSPVALFPQYREAQALAGADRAHPADLWPAERRIREPEGSVTAMPLPYGAEARARLDAAVLRIVKSGDPQAALSLRDTCLGFVAAQQDRQPRAFWKICAGFFEAFGTGLLPADVYVKRVASRVLLQYATLAKGDPTIADRLVQDLLFFCAQAKPVASTAHEVPSLLAVRQAFGLDRFKPVDYETPRFGRFDPAVLAQARKRIAAATETWSALAGGDRNKLKPAADQFSLVCDSLRKLQPDSESLAQALTRAMDATTRSGEPPSAALAMEVATSVLYLQAAFEELDAADGQMEARARRLAERLDAVGAGAEPEPLEQWMEELYRRVSDTQTMGSVVDELRATLGEAEKALDQYFRNPTETAVLASVPGHLAQMRGVLSVLGLDQASLAVVRMRETVDRLLMNEVAAEDRPAMFEKLGNSLGALGFLIDMLSYQRTMARKLFVYDEALGELRILMGKTRARATDASEEAPAKRDERADMPLPHVIPRVAAPEPLSEPTDFGSLPEFFDIPLSPSDAETSAEESVASHLLPELFAFAADPVAAPAVATTPPAALPTLELRPALDVEDELLEVFLEEAREVVVTGNAAIDVLQGEPGNLSEQTTLRRAFHTLKGSSRMVGLNEFGEAAWSMEQMLNAWLAEQKPMKPELLQLSTQALHAFDDWAKDIAAGKPTAWEPAQFHQAAEAMRQSGTLLSLLPLAGAAEADTAIATETQASAAPAAVHDLEADHLVPSHPVMDEAAPVDQALEQAAAEWESVAPVEPVEATLESLHEESLSAPSPVAIEEPLAMPELTLPDFASTELADGLAGLPVLPGAAELAEEIDFSEFAAAMNEVPELASAAPSLEHAEPPVDDFSLNFDLPSFSAKAADSAQTIAAEPLAAAEAATDEPSISLDLPDWFTEPLKTADTAPVAEPAVEADELAGLVDLPDFAHAPQAPVTDPFADAIEAFADFDEAPAVEAEAHAFTDAKNVAELEEHQSVGAALHAPVPAELVAEPAHQHVNDLVGDEDAVKVIDGLRISIPLYNVYLNEADEWSRRLVTCLHEWSLELHEPLPDTAVALSHSLAGSSATVGFSALSDMARVLEHALQHVQLQSVGNPEQARVFMAAADDIRRLLHQFAAGFLKEPSRDVLDKLRQVLETEVGSSLAPLNDEAMDRMLEELEASERAAAEAEAAAESAPPVLDDAVVHALVEQPVEHKPAAMPVGHVAPALSAFTHDYDQEVDDAIAHAVAMDTGMDDDIDAIDVIDPDLFPIFEEEAADLMPQLGGALRQWTARPSNLGARSEVLRALHTLKGSSRLAGAMRLGEMAHRLESAIEALDVDTVTSEQIEPLQGNFDGLQANFDALRAIGQSQVDTVVALPTTEALHAEAAPGVEGADADPKAANAASARAAVAMPLAGKARLPGASPLTQQQRVTASQSVRVRAQLLDRLVNQAGEVMISRSRLDARMGQFRSSLTDLSGNLDRLRQQLRDIEVQAESQMQSRLALSKDSAAGFDPLEFDRFTRVQELTRMMAESVNDVATVQRNLQRSMEGAEDDLIAQGRQARELQRDLLRTRMVEFEGISERLYAVVRQSSKETGKQIKLDITGGSIEMDRGVLDRMTPAFEHLLRNCVAHGIEDPQTRAAAGKPMTGTITVDLHHEGNDVSVEFRDDGAGLNVGRIREKAVSQGLLEANATLSDADAGHMIFLPGFSTATEVTGLSGRGIGMDVVRSEVNALGGRIETTTEAGQGTAFRMVLPLTTAVTQVVMLRAGELAFGVPANVVEIVRRTPVADLEVAYRTGFYDDGIEKIPFFWSGALLQASARSDEPAAKNRPVVIFRSAAQRLAMHVDEVLGNQEVVVKNLGPQLSRLPGLAGMSVLASGAVVLIYNPVALATVYGEQVREATAGVVPAGLTGSDSPVAAGASKPPVSSPQLGGPSQVPLVLVVDDSITVRRVTQRLLQREGYRVALAADGLQALERLQEERPTVVLSDIEMPRMDGFDLARNIRADAALRGLPIIMITSRIAEKHREHAMELGVNHYLGKPYSDEELLSLIQHYARLSAVAVEA
jgi:chemosensory pili system protein ChpA (sensor histidine kinase/response regulator)